MRRCNDYRPTLEEIMETIGYSTMTTKEIAMWFQTTAIKSIYNTMCDAKENGWVEIVWRDTYTPAWRRKG